MMCGNVGASTAGAPMDKVKKTPPTGPGAGAGAGDIAKAESVPTKNKPLEQMIGTLLKDIPPDQLKALFGLA